MRILFIIALHFVCNTFVSAQIGIRQIKVIVLQQDSSKIDGATVKVDQLGKEFSVLTDKEGMANISLAKGASFTIQISHVGFETVIEKYDSLFDQQILKVILVSKSKELTEIKVISEKPFLSIDKNKIVISIDKNKVAGQSVVDILKKAPGITLQNNIILFEGKPISAQLKGKTIRLSLSNLTDYLGGTTAASIDQIEIITVPLANMDAAVSGAMINLKPQKIVDNGFMSGVNLKVGSRSKFMNEGLSSWLNFKANKLSGFMSINYSNDYQVSETKVDRNYAQSNSTGVSHIKETNDGKYRPQNIPVTLSLEYAINNKNQIGAIISGMFSKTELENNSISDVFIGTRRMPDSIMKMASSPTKKNTVGVADIYYKLKLDSLGQELNVDAAFSKMNGSDINLQEYNYFLPDNTAYRSPSFFAQNSTTDLGVISTQIDYIKPITGLKLESGLKYTSTRVEQKLDQTLKRNNSEVYSNKLLIYNESIAAAYINVSGTAATVAYSIGVRGENTSIESPPVELNSGLKRSYLTIFPTVLFSKKTGKSSLVLSYKKTIVRPRFSKLTNFQFYTSPFYYYTGNPMLRPYFPNSIRLSWSYKSKFQLTAGYNWYKNNILEYAELDTVNNLTMGLVGNNGNYRSVSLSPTYASNITKWWNTNTGLSFVNRHLDFVSNDQAINTYNTAFSFYSSNTFTLSKTVKCEVYSFYSSPTYYNAAKTGAYWFVDFSVFKNILKGKGQLSLSINDVFYSNITRTMADYGLINYNSENKWDSRNIVLGFNYSFGSKNYKFKQLRRNSATDDVRSRSN